MSGGGRGPILTSGESSGVVPGRTGPRRAGQALVGLPVQLVGDQLGPVAHCSFEVTGAVGVLKIGRRKKKKQTYTDNCEEKQRTTQPIESLR